jgi:hypothetical protein
MTFSHFFLFPISGNCECALFGSYVDELQRLLANADGSLPVLLIQFAKIKSFRG